MILLCLSFKVQKLRLFHALILIIVILGFNINDFSPFIKFLILIQDFFS